jgi:hypothetical protein
MFQDLFPLIFLILNTTFHEEENIKKTWKWEKFNNENFFLGGIDPHRPPLATALIICLFFIIQISSHTWYWKSLFYWTTKRNGTDFETSSRRYYNQSIKDYRICLPLFRSISYWTFGRKKYISFTIAWRSEIQSSYSSEWIIFMSLRHLYYFD